MSSLTTSGFLEITRRINFNKKIVNKFLDFIPPVSGEARILEVGCGTGFFSAFLQERYVDGSITCVDIDGRLLAEARAKLRPGRSGPPVDFLQADASRLALQTGSMDLAGSHFFYVDCRNAEETLREVVRVVKPGGVVCTMEPIYQIDLLNMHCPYIEENEKELLVGFYREVLLDLPRRNGFDRTITTRLPSLFHEIGLEDIAIELEADFWFSNYLDDKTLGFMAEGARKTLASSSIKRESLAPSPPNLILSRDHLQVIQAIQARVNNSIANDPRNFMTSGTFFSTSVLLISGRKRV